MTGTNGNSRLGTVSLITILFLLVFHMAGYAHIDTDDAYISFRYARNLFRGNGLVFNPGERVEGYTNFLWTILMVPSFAANFDPMTWARILGGLCSLCCIIALAVFARSYRQAILATLWLALHPPFAYWSVDGLETPMFTMLVTFAVLLWWRKESPRLAAILFVLASLTRPEGVLFFVVTLLTSWLLSRQSRTSQWQAALIFVICYGIYFFARYTYYGYLLPNTFYAKTGGDSRISSGLAYICDHAFRKWWPIYTLGLVSTATVHRRRQLALISIVLSYLAYVAWTGGDWMAQHRFIVPILPLSSFMAADVFSSLPRTRHRRIASISLILIVTCFLISGAIPTWQSVYKVPWKIDPNQNKADVLIELGLWFHAHTDPATVIAVVPAGKIPYFADRYTIDMRGLADVHIAHLPIVSPGLMGHEKRDPDYVLSRAPDYIVTTGARLKPGRAPNVGADEERTGPMILDSYPILNRQEFKQNYHPITVPLAVGDKDLYFFARNADTHQRFQSKTLTKQ